MMMSVVVRSAARPNFRENRPQLIRIRLQKSPDDDRSDQYRACNKNLIHWWCSPFLREFVGPHYTRSLE